MNVVVSVWSVQYSGVQCTVVCTLYRVRALPPDVTQIE